MPIAPLLPSNALLAPGIYVDEVDPGVSEMPAVMRENARAALDQLCHRELAWLVFEENHPQTWTQVVQNIRGFLVALWIKDALQGRNVQEAFVIRCDLDTTAEALRNGALICLVGMALVTPSEFVTFRICIKFAPRM